MPQDRLDFAFPSESNLHLLIVITAIAIFFLGDETALYEALLAMRKKRTVGTEEKHHTAFDVDADKLEKNLAEMREPRMYLHNPIFKQLLRVPPEHVVERVTSTFSNLNLTASLMLTGITVIALVPIDVASVSDDRRNMANIFNILATVLMNLSVLNVMITTYILMLLSSEMPSTIYSFLCKADSLTLINFFCTFVQTTLYIALGVIGLWIRSDEWAAITITICSGLLAIGAQMQYGRMESILFPLAHSGFGVLGLGIFWTKSVKQQAKAMGNLFAAEALGHLAQQDGGAQADCLQDEACGRDAAALQGLEDILSKALPDEGGPRKRELAAQMARQGLTAENLRRIAARDVRLLYSVCASLVLESGENTGCGAGTFTRRSAQNCR